MRKISDLNHEEFHRIFFSQSVPIIRLPLSTAKLKEMGNAQRIRFDAVEDFEQLADVHLVWYKNKQQDWVYWDAPDALNLTLKEAVELFVNKPGWFEKRKTDTIWDILNRYKNGQGENVEILSVFDTSIDEVLVIDGLKRALVLYYLYVNDKEILADLLTRHEITVVEFESTIGWFLCPCDFMPLYFNKRKIQQCF